MKINAKSVMLLVLFGVASFCFLIQSPNHPWLYRDVGTDSGVFQTVAMMMNEGFMPYRDSFDHKGPLIYFLDLLGRMVNERWGVCFIEWCSLFYSLIVFFKIAGLVTEKWSVKLMTIFIAALFLLSLFHTDYGNMTEEYAMPLIATSLYLFLNYQIKGSKRWWMIALAGGCFAGVVLLRPNMIATWLVYCICIFVCEIVNKNYNDAIKSVIWFLIGASVVLLPVVIWLGMNGTLKDCWEVYVVFNIKYANSMDHVMVRRAYVLASFALMPVVVLSFCSCVYFILENKFKSSVLNVYFVYLVVALILLSMSARKFPHYAMVLVPATVYPVAMAVDRLVSSNDGLKIIAGFCDRYVKSLMAIISVLFICGAYAVTSFLSGLDKGQIKHETREVCRLIEQNTTAVDRISVYGNFDTVYLFTHRLHATRFSYQHPIITIDENYRNEYWDGMRKELPKVVVVVQTKEVSYLDEDMIEFLNKNGYKQISDDSILHKVYLRMQ